jgi:hypothetical protein
MEIWAILGALGAVVGLVSLALGTGIPGTAFDWLIGVIVAAAVSGLVGGIVGSLAWKLAAARPELTTDTFWWITRPLFYGSPVLVGFALLRWLAFA